MTDELKPCPFCGGKAELKTMDLSAIEEGKKLYAVWCVDDLSTAMSGGYAHGHFIDNYATEEAAVEAWNRRACEIIEGNGTGEALPEIRTCKNTWDVNLTGRLRFQCSECRAVSLEVTPNFCPNCGAKVVDR